MVGDITALRQGVSVIYITMVNARKLSLPRLGQLSVTRRHPRMEDKMLPFEHVADCSRMSSRLDQRGHRVRFRSMLSQVIPSTLICLGIN
jgi:hypothetical protein